MSLNAIPGNSQLTPQGWIADPVERDQVYLDRATGSLVSGDGNPIDVGGGGGSTLYPSGDTSGAADRAAWQALHDALPASGGEIRLARGAFYLASEVVYNRPVKTVGAGGGLIGHANTYPAAATSVYCSSPTANGIRVTASGCTFRDFALVNVAATTPTAGAGILDTSMTNSVIDSMTILGFWNNLDLGGVYYHVTNNRIYDAVNYGIYAHAPSHAVTPSYLDHGDFVLANNIISGWARTYASAANFRWESGGGIKILGNKFNSGGQPGNVAAGVAAYCIDMLVADGCTTSSLVITGNSISGWATNTANIRIGQLGPSNTGKFLQAVIVGNEITLGQRPLIYGAASETQQYIAGLEFSGNTIGYMSVGGVLLRNCQNTHIGTNEWHTSTGPLIEIAPFTGGAISSLRVEPQALGLMDEVTVISDSRVFANGVYASGFGVDYDYTRGVHISAQSTWQTVGVITVPNGSACLLELDIDGQNGNSAHNSYANLGVALRRVRSVDVNTSGVVTLATVGTDLSNGAGAANMGVQFVTGTNTVTIQVQTTDATQLAFWGGARMRVNGKLTAFRIGA